MNAGHKLAAEAAEAAGEAAREAVSHGDEAVRLAMAGRIEWAMDAARAAARCAATAAGWAEGAAGVPAMRDAALAFADDARKAAQDAVVALAAGELLRRCEEAAPALAVEVALAMAEPPAVVEAELAGRLDDEHWPTWGEVIEAWRPEIDGHGNAGLAAAGDRLAARNARRANRA